MGWLFWGVFSADAFEGFYVTVFSAAADGFSCDRESFFYCDHYVGVIYDFPFCCVFAPEPEEVCFVVEEGLDFLE